MNLKETFKVGSTLYTQTKLPSDDLMLGGLPIIKEGQELAGYIDYKDAVVNPEQIMMNIVYRYMPHPDLLNPEVTMFAPTYYGKPANGYRVLVAVGYDYLMEKIVRETMNPLKLSDEKVMKKFFADLIAYNKQAAERKEEQELRSLAQQVADVRGISIDEALKILTSPKAA